MKFETEAIHTAYNPQEHNRAIMPPIYQNSMFVMNEIGEAIPFRYARVSNPSRTILEETVANLEFGDSGFAFSSGMAAIDCVWRAILKPGDTILAVADIYGGSYDLLTEVYAHWGINIIFADLTDESHLDELLSSQTIKLLWLESPSNPLLRLVNIASISNKAHQHGIIVGIDNTFATPYSQNPLNLGADIVVHSATKYLCGHSDVLLGIAVCKHKEHARLIRNMQIMGGAVAGPMDCALVLRGIKTLALRMEKHQQNALEIAKRLVSHPAIEAVFYPGLETHEQHELAKQQMNGYGGVVSIYLKNDSREAANTVIKALKVLQMASSLGGVESLVNHSATQSHSGMSTETKQQLGIREGLLRFSIGIEHLDDIWQDIDQALNTLSQTT